jgi:hypothetical protein
MIDHNMAFRDEAAARADKVVGKYWHPSATNPPGSWGPECNFNTLIWDPADDTTETVDGPNGPVDVVTHHPLDHQFRVTITLPEPAADLVNHKSNELAVDHETGEVLHTSFTQPQREALRMQPVFAGSKYPFLDGTGGL